MEQDGDYQRSWQQRAEDFCGFSNRNVSCLLSSHNASIKPDSLLYIFHVFYSFLPLLYINKEPCAGETADEIFFLILFLSARDQPKLPGLSSRH